MLFIFGTRYSHLKSFHTSLTCPNCKNPETITMSVFQKYFHMMRVSVIPLDKTAATQCSECKEMRRRESFPVDFHLVYGEIYSQVKTPIWCYTGAVIIGLSMVYNVIKSIK